MKKFFRSLGVFLRALPTFLLFEFMFKLLLVALGAPILALALKLTMNVSGISYIYDENLVTYLHHPVTIFVVLIMLFVSGFFSFIELSALAACFSCFSRGESITVGGMFRTGLKSFRKTMRGAGIFEFLVFMLFMPFTEFTLSSGVFMAPLLPILRRTVGIISPRLAVTVYILIQAMLVLLMVSLSYSLHYLVLTDRRFPECVRASRERIRRKKLSTAVRFLIWTLAVLTITAALTFGLSFIIVCFIKGFGKPEKAFRTALYVLKYATSVFTAVSAFLSAPAIMCWLTENFFTGLSAEEKFTLPDRDHVKMDKRRKAALIIAVSLAAFVLDFGYVRLLYKGNIKFAAGVFTRAQISAHRGFSGIAPENTVYAFEAALESRTDYIELDVQLTKDGQLVVFHDPTISRTTDGTGKLANYTYAELQQFSAGNWYGRSGEFDDAKIMLLSEVFDLVGKRKLFNIEIKDSGAPFEATEKTVALIREYGLEGSCYVSSFSYGILRHVKSLEPKIKTALIANMAVSTSYSDLKYIDALSMNYIFVNRSVVNAAHQNGKLIFVWTVNRKNDLEQMVALGVDNIITDRPDKAVEAIYSESLGDTVIHILEIIFQ